MRMSRRRMLASLLSIGGGALLPRFGRAHEHGGKQPVAIPVVVFEPDVRRTLVAAMERILPGAADAGVPEHIEYWLGREPFLSAQREFKAAAFHLDRLARQEQHRGFADSPPEIQDKILKSFQEGSVKEKGFDGAAFFPRLVSFVLEGFLGDPQYGGNRKQVGWRFIGHRACWWAPKRIRRLLRPGQGLAE